MRRATRETYESVEGIQKWEFLKNVNDQRRAPAIINSPRPSLRLLVYKSICCKVVLVGVAHEFGKPFVFSVGVDVRMRKSFSAVSN